MSATRRLVIDVDEGWQEWLSDGMQYVESDETFRLVPDAEAERGVRRRIAGEIRRYADDRLVETGVPNRSEDITAALRAVAAKVEAGS